MVTFLSEVPQRQLKLISILLQEKRSYSKKELADQMKISIKTLITDLLTIHTYLPKSGAALVIEKNSVFLGLDGTYGYRYFLGIFIYKSLLFQLSRDILSETITTTQEWALNNRISLATAYRRLNELEDWLSKNNLLFDKKNLGIRGSEANIRLYFYNLLYNTYYYTGWPFPEIPQEPIHKFIDQFAEKNQLVISEPAKTCYAIFIAICLLRNRNHPIPLDEVPNDILSLFPEDNLWLFTSLEAELNLSLELPEKMYIITSVYILNFSYASKAAINNRIQQAQDLASPHYQLAIEFNDLVTGYSFVESNEYIFVAILDFFDSLTLLKKIKLISPLSYIQEQEELKQLNNNQFLKQLTKQIDHIINQNSKEFPILRLNRDIILHKFSRFFQSYLYQDTSVTLLKVGVLSTFDYGWEQTIHSLIRRHYSKEQIELVTKVNLTENNIDLVITDFPLPINTTIPWITWSYAPTARDYSNLEAYFH